jgi:hypothetical protein
MRIRLVASVVVALIALPVVVTAPAQADPGVPVFHDRVVKRDRAGDVKGDRTTPIDIGKVQYDHYKTGDNERFVVTVHFNNRVRKGSELRWSTSTGAGGYSLEFVSTVAGAFVLERDNRKVRHPHARRAVEGRTVTITIPWGKLGSPAKLVGHSFAATLFKPPEWSGIDIANKPRALLD